MKTIIKTLLLIIFVTIVLLQISCSETTKPKPSDVGEANALARQGFEIMNQEAERLSEVDNISGQNDVMLESKFNEIEGIFNQAIALDADNPMAHLGMSILEVMRMNYDPDLWTLMEDMQDSGFERQSLLNNQIEFLSRVPSMLFKNYKMDSKDVMSISRFQDFIADHVNPRLESSLNHLAHAVNMADSSSIMIDTGEEMIEIDAGEIYAFRASVKILNAAFYMLTAYNWDMIGADGTYNWTNDMYHNYAPEDLTLWDPYEYVVENQVLKLYYWDYDSPREYSFPYQWEVGAKTLKHNLLNNSAFATLNQARLTNAKNNILGAAADIRSGANHIMAETDDQTNDVIKMQYIIDLNAEISEDNPDNPPFMQSWNSINDVVGWLESLINGGNFTTTTPDNLELTVNFGAFFNGAVPDIKAVTPYMYWRSSDVSWLELKTDMWNWYTESYSFWSDGDMIDVDNLTEVQFIYQKYEINPGYFTTPTGTQIQDGELPYFPDYTMNGIFPGMTRTKFIQLFGN